MKPKRKKQKKNLKNKLTPAEKKTLKKYKGASFPIRNFSIESITLFQSDFIMSLQDTDLEEVKKIVKELNNLLEV